MSGTFTDFSWPDEPGLWTGMDGVEYDVEISTEQDEVGVARTLLVIVLLGFFYPFITVSFRFVFLSVYVSGFFPLRFDFFFHSGATKSCFVFPSFDRCRVTELLFVVGLWGGWVDIFSP